MRRRAAGGFTLIELVAVVAILAILASVGVTMVSYALRRSNQTGCGERLKALVKAVKAYNLTYNFYPPRAGGAFWKALYVDRQTFEPDLEQYLCPASGDRNRDQNGIPYWTEGDPSNPQPIECSYAGPKSTSGMLKVGSLLGCDDDEGPTGGSEPNHPDGLNVAYDTDSIKWFEFPDGFIVRVGETPPGKLAGELAGLLDMQN